MTNKADYKCYFIAASETSATLPVQVTTQRADHQISKCGKATGCANCSLSPFRDEWKLQIITAYGLAQSNAGAQDFNEELLALAAQRVQQVNLPAIIVGGFNADVSKLASASTLAKMCILHLQQLYSSMYGCVTPPACKEATTPDTAFSSPELLPRRQRIEVLQNQLFDARKVHFSLRLPSLNHSRTL